MAKITRYTGDLQAFASESLGTERTVFGDVTQADDLDSNINTDFLRGWGIVGVNENPTKQDFNALGFTSTQLLSYLHQMGMAEWDGAQEYQIGSFANRSGAIYRCLTADHVSATAPESDATNWKYLLSADDVTYDNTTSGATATDVQAAIDEVFTAVTVQDQATWNTGTSTTEGVISPLKLDTKIKTLTIGDGQTWQNVTGSRAGNIVYTNTTGKSIVWNLSRNKASLGDMEVDGVVVNEMYDEEGNPMGNATAIVPDGSTYEFTGTIGVFYWAELR